MDPQAGTVNTVVVEPAPTATETPAAVFISTFLDIQGIYDYRHLDRIQKKIMTQLPDQSEFIEKRMKRGRVMVLLKTVLPTAAILQRIQTIDLEPGRFRVLEEDDNLLRVSVR